jgi:hypothetical protein
LLMPTVCARRSFRGKPCLGNCAAEHPQRSVDSFSQK